MVSSGFVTGDNTPTVAPVSGSASTFTASPKSGQQLLDDGNGGSTLTFTAKDENGAAVTGLTDINFVSSLAGSTVSAVAETPAGSGIYVAKLTSTTAGKSTVGVQQGSTDIAVNPQEVTFTHKA